MKLQHYLGGLEGLGPVSTDTRVFADIWETRIFGIHAAMMALSSHLTLPKTSSTFDTGWTWADLRKGAEALNPFDYFKFRYYEKWLGGISGYFIERGYITAEELDALTEEYYAHPNKPVPEGGTEEIDKRIVQYLVEGDNPRRDVHPTYEFKAGDVVEIGNPPSIEHSRLPGFLRGKTGTVEKVYDGAFTYLCDTGPDGIGPAMPVYCVCFDSETIWPGNAEKNFLIHADLYAAYVKAPATAKTKAA
jgi:nitrile hydratase subunit beta